MVISKKDFDKLLRRRMSFVEFLRYSPLRGLKIRLLRKRSLTRKVKL